MNKSRNGRAIISVLASALLLVSAGHAQDDKKPEFLRGGKPLSQQLDKLSARELRRYERAFASFQSVDDCVAIAEGEQSYELSRMRWNHLNTLEKVNFCVFLLAAELNSHEKMLHWFNSNGFEAKLIETSPNVMRIYNHDGDGIKVSATASIKGPVRVGLLDWLFAHSVSVGVTFTSDGEPLDVNTTITRI